MQRWMEAKVARAKVNGTARSGANRAIGDVWDDRPVGPAKREKFQPVAKRPEQVNIQDRIFTVSPVLKKVNGFIVARKRDRNDKNRAARRAHLQMVK